MLSKDEITAQAVEKEMHTIYDQLGLEHHTYVTTINKEGVKFIN